MPSRSAQLSRSAALTTISCGVSVWLIRAVISSRNASSGRATGHPFPVLASALISAAAATGTTRGAPVATTEVVTV